MKNEYGAELDQNGYAPSIVQEDLSCCYICGTRAGKLDRHEPFNGANRTKSKALGLWVMLCHDGCHRMAHQYPRDFGEAMKRETQAKAMRTYGWSFDEWRRRFGKNVL